MMSGQLLVAPVTSADFTRPSYADNADGYALTTTLMQWFWDHYADAERPQRPEGRTAPRAGPDAVAAGAWS